MAQPIRQAVFSNHPSGYRRKLKNLKFLTLFLLLPLVSGWLSACTDDSTLPNAPTFVAVREDCQSKSGMKYDCVEQTAGAAFNPGICQLVGIGIDDICLQAVYKAANDLTICDRIYLQGGVPNCRAYYVQRTTALD